MLQYGTSRILFPGDAGKLAFEALANRLNEGKPMACHILAAPHHSGKLTRGSIALNGYRNCYHWLYEKIVQPKYMVISVGTANTYDHPKQEHLIEAIQVGTTVICTQMTHKCHSDVNSLSPGLLDPAPHPAACNLKSGIGCGGTIVATLDYQEVKISRLRAHQHLVDELVKLQTPLCRP